MRNTGMRKTHRDENGIHLDRKETIGVAVILIIPLSLRVYHVQYTLMGREEAGLRQTMSGRCSGSPKILRQSPPSLSRAKEARRV